MSVSRHLRRVAGGAGAAVAAGAGVVVLLVALAGLLIASERAAPAHAHRLAANNANNANNAIKAAPACRAHWVGSWLAVPTDASAASALHDQTLRMVIAPHLAGDLVRLHLSNRFGTAPVTLGPVTLARRGAGAGVIADSLTAVRFDGRRTTTIAPGGEVVSDPVRVHVVAFGALAVSVAVRGSVTAVTEHFLTRQANYLSRVGSGDLSGQASGAGFAALGGGSGRGGWDFLDGLDVLAAGDTGAVVAFGDSITDGYVPPTAAISGIGANARYPDDLQRRLIAARIPLAVLDSGIAGNRLLRNGAVPIYGSAGLSRLRADALGQAGVTDVILLEGINDIGRAPHAGAAALIAGYESAIARAHAAHLAIQLGTITPARGAARAGYGGARANAVRVAVNRWIRSQSQSDGIVDFDAALRDRSDPARLATRDDGSDHLHPSVAGYRAMAAAIDLRLLRRARCTPVVAGAVRASRTVSRRLTIGHSVDGRPIYAWSFGPDRAKRKVLVVGCIHGNECAAFAILAALRHTAVPAGVQLWLVPEFNPDGTAADTRQNAHGVDLNRNFPYRWAAISDPVYYSGPHPESEPETRAAMAFIRRIRPAVTIWYHQHMDLTDESGGDFGLIRRYAQISGLRATCLTFLSGEATRWSNHTFPGTTAFVVELPAGPVPPSAVARHVRAVRALELGQRTGSATRCDSVTTAA